MATSVLPMRSAATYRALYDVGPKKVPNVSTQEVSVAVRLRRVRLINNTGAPITVSVTDGQGSPISCIPTNYTLNPGGFLIYTNESFGDLAPGGLVWQASAPGLDGYMQATD